MAEYIWVCIFIEGQVKSLDVEGDVWRISEKQISSTYSTILTFKYLNLMYLTPLKVAEPLI